MAGEELLYYGIRKNAVRKMIGRRDFNFCLEFSVIAMGFYNAFEIAEFALENVADCGEPVDAFPEKNLCVFAFFRKVFPEHQKVVTVIEVEFPRRIVWKGSASHVIDLALGYAPDLMAGKRGSPAEIDFLHVGEKLFF